MDGARRLGRLARLLSIVFIVMGIIIIIVATTVNFAGEAQPYASLLGVWEAKGVAWPPGAGAVGRGEGKGPGGHNSSSHSRKATQFPAEWDWLSELSYASVDQKESGEERGPRSQRLQWPWVLGWCLVEPHRFYV